MIAPERRPRAGCLPGLPVHGPRCLGSLTTCGQRAFTAQAAANTANQAIADR
jgi:hypothetical protein